MRILLLRAAFLLIAVPSFADVTVTGTQLTAEEIVARLAARDLDRQASVDGYVGKRRYVFDNRHMQKHAEMLVDVKGDADGTKHFQVISEDGWKAAHKHVLRKMLESESETSRPELRSRSKINPENYEFKLTGTEMVAERLAYILEITPKRKEKYLFRGHIWVDAEDYALVRAEGNPAKNPSFWTRSTHFVHIYQKNGALWFPLATKSVTDAMIFGTTDVNIEYFDYAAKTPGTTNNASMTAAEMPKK